MNPKVKSMLAHLTPAGWLLSLLLNNFKKDPVTSFYLRQLLGLYLCFFVTRFIPEYFITVWGFIFIFWVYSFVGIVKGIEQPIPFMGPLFQKWFKIIS
ncbi:MAG TPA: hypothetical protein VFG54_15420 [Prolixibacteraceae bacterium]|nr:hypothetical protein [Prolixibacteraceae bacterium]